MKKILLLIVIAANGYCLLQAQDLYGFVLEQNSGKKPVAGVMIKSTFGANQKTTTTRGDYTLNFQDAKPGKSVMLSVEKENWVITDKDKLQAVLPEDPLHHPHIIILCRRDVWERQNKDFKTLLEKYIKTSYDREKAALDKQDKQYQSIIDSLQDKYAGLEKNLNELAEIYANTNLDEVSETERKAYLLFKEGKIDESIALRKSFDSEKNFKKAREKQRQLDSLNKRLDTARTATQNEIDFHKRNLREEAQLAKLKYDFKTAEEKLGFLAVNDSADFYSLFDYAYFFFYLNRYDKALFWYNKALPLAPNSADKANIEYELGNLYWQSNNYQAAEKLLIDALSIFRDLAASEPSVYKTDVAKLLTIFGAFEVDRNNYPAAEKYLLEALEIKKKLAQDDPVHYEADVALILINLGDLHGDQNNFPAALKELREALEIYRRLAKNNRFTYDSKIASTLGNLGIVYIQQNNYIEAEKAYLESIQIRRELFKNNPETYEPQLVTGLTNIGDMYFHQHNYINAEKFLQESYERIKRLAAIYPASYNNTLATVLESLGSSYLTFKKYPSAKSAYLESLAIWRKLSQDNPAVYEPHVATTLSNLGILYDDESDFPEAEKALLESLEIRRRLASANPDKYEPDLTNSLNSLGAMYNNKKDYPASKKAYLEALQIREKLANRNPDAFEPELASLNLNLGLLCKSENSFPEAARYFITAIHKYDHCLTINATQYELFYCRIVLLLGDLYLEHLIEDDISEYLVYSRKADSILTKYPADNEWKPIKIMIDKSLNNPVAKKMNVLRVKHEQQQSPLEKIKIQEQIVEIGKQLSEAEPDLYALDLSNDLANLSWDLIMEKQFVKAENAAREALTPSFKNLPVGYADETKWINTNLAAALLFQNKYEEAEKIYLLLKNQKKGDGTYKDVFLADLDEFEKAGITNPNVEKIRALLKQP